ncbi:MAG: hypothetical protein ACOZEN_08755 [Thermodesulfobacteriota bacterium]
MRRIHLPLLLAASLTLAGCGGMTAQQKQAVRQDVLLGLEIVAAGVAGMPSADPVAAYWGRYAAGVLEQVRR